MTFTGADGPIWLETLAMTLPRSSSMFCQNKVSKSEERIVRKNRGKRIDIPVCQHPLGQRYSFSTSWEAFQQQSYLFFWNSAKSKYKACSNNKATTSVKVEKLTSKKKEEKQNTFLSSLTVKSTGLWEEVEAVLDLAPGVKTNRY
jgi:outer membrane translocation and assembly module TamA